MKEKDSRQKELFVEELRRMAENCARGRASHKNSLMSVALRLGIKVQRDLKYTPNELLSLILQCIDQLELKLKNQKKRLRQLEKRVTKEAPCDTFWQTEEMRGY